MADIYVGSRERKPNRAAAALATLALLAGSIVASAAPVDAAPTQPGDQSRRTRAADGHALSHHLRRAGQPPLIYLLIGMRAGGAEPSVGSPFTKE